MIVKKLDNYLIDKFQMGFDWFWNLTGITKGLVMVYLSSVELLYISSESIKNGFNFFDYLGLFCFAIFTLVGFKHHDLQKKGHYKEINKYSLSNRESISGLFFRITTLGMAISNSIVGVILIVMTGKLVFLVFPFVITTVCMLYFLLTVLVKDREKKEFFTKEVWNGV